MPARNIATGAEISPKVVEGLLNAPAIGDRKYLTFIHERLVTGEVGFFEPLKKVIIDTGLKKKKSKPKAVTVIQEDRQGFLISMLRCSIRSPLFHSVWQIQMDHCAQLRSIFSGTN